MKREPAPGVVIFCLAHCPIRAEAPSAKPLSGRQTKPKEIQGKPRKKAWISLESLGRIGTFQWVTANPNKKFSSGNPSSSPGEPPKRREGWVAGIELICITLFLFCQKISPPGLPGRANGSTRVPCGARRWSAQCWARSEPGLQPHDRRRLRRP